MFWVLIEMVLLRNHNILCFVEEIRKFSFGYALLPGGLEQSAVAQLVER